MAITASSTDDVACLRRRNDELTQELVQSRGELGQALERQSATSEILRVISSSPADVRPVFDNIVGSAVRLCKAEFSAVARFDGGLLHLGAINKMSAEEMAAFH